MNISNTININNKTSFKKVTLGNLEMQPLRAVTKMLPPGAIGKIQPPDCKGENQNNLSPRAMLRMQSPAAIGKHYTQEHPGKP